VAFAQLCPLRQVDEFITDREVDRDQVEALEAAGVTVTCV
jgi:DeoR/GlpR family transcriptional regulator of sugar metabolism